MGKKRSKKPATGPEGAPGRGRARRRQPVFALSREQVFEKCWKSGHRLICAGEALALRDLMALRERSILETAEHTQVSRQMISALLNLECFPTAELLDQGGGLLRLEAL